MTFVVRCLLDFWETGEGVKSHQRLREKGGVQVVEGQEVREDSQGRKRGRVGLGMRRLLGKDRDEQRENRPWIQRRDC